jgi:hypothetical protein
MKKKLLLMALLPISLIAQNLQVMYDFGSGRKNVTSTLEMFKPDKWGDTFFFVDMEFNGGTEKQPSLAYMEIARCLKFWDGPISAHVEYNGGLLLGFPINNAYLAGVDYAWHDKAFSKFLNFKVLYKNIQGVDPASFQLTGVWNLNYLNKKLTVSGFADFWKEKSTYIFLTEPQIWYNFSSNLSVGGEVEIGSNFGGVSGFKVCPALGAKWNF